MIYYVVEEVGMDVPDGAISGSTRASVDGTHELHRCEGPSMPADALTLEGAHELMATEAWSATIDYVE